MIHFVYLDLYHFMNNEYNTGMYNLEIQFLLSTSAFKKKY